jgi:hypothetical protein
MTYLRAGDLASACAIAEEIEALPDAALTSVVFPQNVCCIADGLLPASHVSAIVGRQVTALAGPTNDSAGRSVCLYEAGRPFFQFGVSVMENEAVAAQNFKLQQQPAAKQRNVASRQKGNVVRQASRSAPI